jgi:NAD(P)-dependent dehydrogenase (short-subunit alcohol dehydrogenase family)
MTGKSVVVVGGGRGLGLAVARAAREAGAKVTAVARSPLDGGEQGDATDDTFADKVLTAHRPDLLVITAGAIPVMRPLTGHTWETFSVNWHSDVRIAFTWLRAALRLPLPPGARVVVFGSAAELRGSPLSGGYAGAKATVRFVSQYAAAESERQALGIRFTAVLPSLTPATALGLEGAAAYAAYEGISLEAFVARMGQPLTPDAVGAALLALATGAEQPEALAYTLSATGLALLGTP